MVLCWKYYILQLSKFVASSNRVYLFSLQWSSVPGITHNVQDQGILILSENVDIRFWWKWPKWIFVVAVFSANEFAGFPAGIYLFKFNNGNTRTMWEICSKLTIKTPRWRHFPAVSIGFLWKKERFFKNFLQVIKSFECFRWKCSFQCSKLIKLVF